MNTAPVRYSPFPRALEIQTVSYCNAHCTICPFGDVYKQLPSGIMDMGLFIRLIDQVPSAWGVRIIPYLNSEPFLDPLLIDRLRYVNEHLPGSEIEISTNVSMLNEAMQTRLQGIELKELRLSVFGFTAQTHKQAMPLLHWERVKRNLKSLACNVDLRENIGQLSLIVVNYPDLQPEDIALARDFCRQYNIKLERWGFMDRSRNVVRYSNKVHRDVVRGCSQNRPLDRMHVMHTGQVVLCCHDWKWQQVLGDLTMQSIQEVWNSPAYQDIRRRIYRDGNQAPDICKHCVLAL